MSLNPALVSAYRFHKARMLNSAASARVTNPTPYVRRIREERPPAVTAIELARRDTPNGVNPYPYDGKVYAAVCWQAQDDDARRRGERLGYVQSIEGAGLRYVGRVSIEGRRGVFDERESEGWITDPYGDVFKDGTGLCWGVVYQLPARDGKARFVAGYIFGGCSDDTPTVDFATIFEEDARGGYNLTPQDFDAACDAARAADHMAQREAEKAREYQSAYGAGSRYADLGAEIAESRKAALAILKERRAVKGMSGYPNLCSAIRASIQGHIADIAKARKARAAMADGEGYGRESWLSFWPGEQRLRDAFNEGAGSIVLA